ncbi:MAG: hypothetical protein AB7O52_08385 [Planctomycetota bacterium]
MRGAPAFEEDSRGNRTVDDRGHDRFIRFGHSMRAALEFQAFCILQQVEKADKGEIRGGRVDPPRGPDESRQGQEIHP